MIFLSILFFTSCNVVTDKPIKTEPKDSYSNTSIDRTKYNLEVKINDKIECPILIGRIKDIFIENEPYFLDTINYYRFKSIKGVNHKYKFLWPCNLPDLVKPGDSVLLSGILYSIGGDEKLPGVPIIISKILLHDKYINRLTNFQKK